MYMMEKLDAYKQEIEKQNAWKEYSNKHNWTRKNPVEEQELLVLYAQEMLRIHDDLKKYCNALVAKATEHQWEVPYLVAEIKELKKKNEEINAKYKALKKKTTPAKKPAAKKPAPSAEKKPAVKKGT